MLKKRCTAIVLAAGQGKRMGTKVQKQYLEIEGKPILYYSMKAFEDSAIIDDMILVVGQNQEEYCRKEIIERYGFRKVRRVVEGGAERYHSVFCGLCAIDAKDAGYVFIHDGARPFVDEEILKRAYDTVRETSACVVGMPVKDTVKITDKNLFAKETPVRKDVWQVQTPQVFEYGLVFDAYERILKRDDIHVTDDAMVVETMTDCPVKLVEGSYENIKITTPEDLDIAAVFLKRRS